MEYQVIREFSDRFDDMHRYRVGDKFPRKGKVKKERLEQLLTPKNAYNIPFIEEVVLVDMLQVGEDAEEVGEVDESTADTDGAETIQD
jgi:hypothetical protein